MNSKKRMLIVLCIVFAVNLMVIGTIFQLFYSTAASATVFQSAAKASPELSKTSVVADSAVNHIEVSTKSLYNIYISSKWMRITRNGGNDYLAAQYFALNTAGSSFKKYSASILVTTKVVTPIKTGPGVSYYNVIQLPLGETLELLGEITNPAGEKWFMYKYADAICYVASSDVQNIVQPATSTTSASTTTTKTTKPSVPTTQPPPPSPPVASSENAQKIVSLAYSKLGFAYVYGATGPNSFDCSGFVYWVVNNSGIPGLSVPRTSIALYEKFISYNIGTSVANAKPGDIILFSKDGTPGGISHSAIYYKDSKMIHASEPSTGVILTTVAYSTSNKSVFAIIRLPGC